MTTPRGIRNNNPGNIRRNNDPWQGLDEVQRDPEFFQFKEAVWGIRAMARTLVTYQDKYSLSSIRQIISRWAPPSENNTESYIRFVCQKTGFDRDRTLDLHLFRHLEPVIKAMIEMECGVMPYTDSEIIKGLVLTGVEPDKKDFGPSRTIVSAQVAAASTVVGSVFEQLQPITPGLTKLADTAPLVFAVIAFLAISFIVFARWDDSRKGLR